MKLGFVGTGHVGGTLARRLGKKGHLITLGTRDARSGDLQTLAATIGKHAEVANIRDCIAKSDVIFLATPWAAVEGFIDQHRELLQNKVLIDCTNPIKADLSGLVLSGETSGGELIQTRLPKTKVVKAFNTVGYNIMEDPVLGDRRAIMYFAGNDETARHCVRELIEDVGFEPMDAGDIRACRLLEPFALLWISTAYKFGLGRDFAFTLSKRK